MKLFAGVRLFISALILTGLGFGLQACSGGGGTTTPVNANATGYYTGSADVKAPGSPSTNYNIADLQIMISGNRIMMMSDAKAVLYDGTFTVSGNTLTSTVAIYYNGNKQSGAAGTATLNATVTQGSQITGSFSGTELGNGTFVSTLNNLSNTNSTFTVLGNNSWLAYLNESNPANTPGSDFEFRSFLNGTIGDLTVTNESDFAGCTPTGTFTPITNESLMTVSITFTICTNPTVNGTYTGFLQNKSTAISADTFALSVSNGTFAFADNFSRN